MSKVSEDIIKKYGKSRVGKDGKELSYSAIAKEFGVNTVVAYYALTRYKGKGQGFQALKPEERKEMSRMGGKAVQAQGKGHRWNSDEAAQAGKIGGAVKKKDGQEATP